MMKIGAYQRAQTIVEALACAKAHSGASAYLAGGTDVLVQARDDARFQTICLIDLSDIAELKGIQECGDTLEIGALTTHAQIHASALVQEHCPLLARACLTVGSPQIRNRGTIGGNITNASPAADSLSALAALGATVEVALVDGTRKVMALHDIIAGSYKTTIAKDTLLVKVILPKHTGHAFSYFKLGRRNSLSISRLTIAAVAKLAQDGTVESFRLAVGSVFPKPLVFDEVCGMLVGKRPTAAEIAAFAKATAAKIPEIAGVRATTSYKQPVCEKLTERITNKLLGGNV